MEFGAGRFKRPRSGRPCVCRVRGQRAERAIGSTHPADARPATTGPHGRLLDSPEFGAYFCAEGSDRPTTKLAALEIVYVIVGAQKCVDLGRVSELDPEHPAPIIRTIVNKFGMLLEVFVDFDDVTADGRNKLGSRFN